MNAVQQKPCEDTAPHVERSHERERYHLTIPDCGQGAAQRRTVGLLRYADTADEDGATVRNLASTIIDHGHERKGYASMLARTALEDARRERVRVIPTCWFVSGWIERHPEFAELVEPAVERRQQ